MRELESTPVIELVPATKQERKLRKPIIKSAAVVLGSLTLTAGFAKAMDVSSEEYKLAIATADSFPDGADTTTPITTTTVVYETTVPVDSTIPVDTTSPDVQDPETTAPDNSITTTTMPTDNSNPGDVAEPPITTTPGTISPDTSAPLITEPSPYDYYRTICLPLGWTNCAEYNIYDESGAEVNRVIANSDWAAQYIAEISGGGSNGSAVKIRDINPL